MMNDKIPMGRPPIGEVEDLATLARLDEQTLLKELKVRYGRDTIYTYVGDILVALNPFKSLPIYDKKHATVYRRAHKSKEPPHIYAIADASYHSMLDSQRNQCCVITGESGAGNTESAKYLISQLIELCQGEPTLEQKIIQVNPLLEAFGHAQTVMNDNSSRFGKYTQLKFNRQGKILGAKISEYLLEKSRVVRQAPGERNFHIFYYLFAGLNGEKQQKYKLGNPDDQRYLSNGSSPLKRYKKELSNGYDALQTAMDIVGFLAEEQENLFFALGGLLNLGNVRFEGDADHSMVSDLDRPLKHAAVLFGLDPMQLVDMMTVSVTVTRGEQIRRNLGVQRALDARDAIAKAVYGRLFGWIVNRVNTLLAPESKVSQTDIIEIGILDIFGFENLNQNSFEQACINLANEQLQYFFNEHIFRMELEEYNKEGIDVTNITYEDNMPILNFFMMKPIGFLALLDEDSHFPQATDLSFLEKTDANFKKLPFFARAKDTKSTLFTLSHYAGKVEYDTNSFLEKNRDALPSGAIEMLQISENELLSHIFRGTITRTGTLALQSHREARRDACRDRHRDARRDKGARKTRMQSRAFAEKGKSVRKMTVGGQFKSSLEVLMEKMNAASPHFVRCIKPNKQKRANLFEDHYVTAQLNYCGMLETTRIRREGYAIRSTFEEFFTRYKALAKKNLTVPDEASCRVILEGTGIKNWHIGKTKVFLKYWHVETLTDLLEKVHQAATCWPPPLPTVPSTADLPPPPLPDSDESDDDLDEFEEVIPKWADPNKRFGRQGTKAASVRWFQETQVSQTTTANGQFHEWFHGIITRRAAEQMLTRKPIGCFIIRVSESRFGYSLSFRVADRCKHYMIDQTPSGRFIIVGEPKVHKNLATLVAYHQKNHINEQGDLLTVACGQDSDEELDYADLVATSQQAKMLQSSRDTSARVSRPGGRSPGMAHRSRQQRGGFAAPASSRSGGSRLKGPTGGGAPPLPPR
ncbi:myosin-IIIb-like [Oscarella lobularis]|uniref:myosin-IIIb-like n=1 Tax=Oscarella lobularis TaxID=121494 RepID=UPI0033132424